jgi:hypothetical protein
MKIEEVIFHLTKGETDFLKIKTFSNQPGIYAIFFIGTEFPLFNTEIRRHQIIYIGKTQTSQESRDSKTHFSDGKTGSSTVRKSVGSILHKSRNLIPIPRNDSDYIKGRKNHFKFNDESEIIITNWMKNNLALSFFEFLGDVNSLDELETQLIRKLNPILNIDHKSTENLFKSQIKGLRKTCALLANNDTEAKPIKIGDSNFVDISKPIQRSLKSDSITISNVTMRDSDKKIIRITKDNKHLFPTEKSGIPMTYELNFKVNNEFFIASYIIGSQDGKSRSGVLKLNAKIYKEILKITKGTNLKISKTDDNVYTIQKL